MFLEKFENLILFLILAGVPLITSNKPDDPNILKLLLFEIGTVIWTFIYLVKCLIKKEAWFPINHLITAALLFFLVTKISQQFSSCFELGSIRLQRISIFIIFFYLTSQLINNQNKAKKTLEFVVYSAFFLSCLGVLQSYGIVLSSFGQDISRISATLGHPNFLAGYLVGVLPVTVGFFISNKKRNSRYFYASCILVQTSCLFLTLSRSAWASMTVVFAFFGLSCLRYRQIDLFAFLKTKKAIAMMLVLLSIPFFIPSVFESIPKSETKRLTQLVTPSPQNTVWIRWLEWKGAFEIIKAAPLIGNGPGTFSRFFPEKQPREFSSVCVERNEFLRHAHNEYLEIWSETGILGLMVFMYLLISAITSGMRLVRENKDVNAFFIYLGLVAGVIGICFHMLFSVSFRFVAVPLLFWFYLGVVNGMISIRNGQTMNRQLFGINRVFFVLPTIGLLLFLVFSLNKTHSSLIAEKYLQEGLQKYQSGKMVEALQKIETALGHSSTKPEIYYKKGTLESNLGRWNKALETYRAIARLHPDFCHNNFNLSVCHLKMKDFANSIRCGERELKLYPDFAEQYYILGKAYYFSGNYKQAEKYFVQYLEFYPNNSSAHSYLGNILAFRREWQKAITHYEKILKQNPDNLRVRMNVAQLYMEMGNVEKACESLSIVSSKGQCAVLFEDYKKIIKKIENTHNREYLTQVCPRLFAELKKVNFGP